KAAFKDVLDAAVVGRGAVGHGACTNELLAAVEDRPVGDPAADDGGGTAREDRRVDGRAAAGDVHDVAVDNRVLDRPALVDVDVTLIEDRAGRRAEDLDVRLVLDGGAETLAAGLDRFVAAVEDGADVGPPRTDQEIAAGQHGDAGHGLP